MTVLSGGDVDVTAGTGFRKGHPLPLVRLTVTTTAGESVLIWMRPIEARAVGLDMIGAAHAAINDAAVRVMAKDHGPGGADLSRGIRRAGDEAMTEPQTRAGRRLVDDWKHQRFTNPTEDILAIEAEAASLAPTPPDALHSDGCAGGCGTNDHDNPPCPAQDEKIWLTRVNQARNDRDWKALNDLVLEGQPAPTPPDALDVERLAAAMRAISLIPSLYRGPVAAWVPTAAAIAREYAALAATEGADHE